MCTLVQVECVHNASLVVQERGGGVAERVGFVRTRTQSQNGCLIKLPDVTPNQRGRPTLHAGESAPPTKRHGGTKGDIGSPSEEEAH